MKQLSPAAAAAILILSLSGLALATDYNPPFKPLVAIGGQTRLIYPDFPVELLVSEEQSGGQFGMVVLYTQPNDGPADNMLLEYKLTETFYVLSGQYRFEVGDEVYEGGAGTVVVNPPNVPHGFINIGDETGKLLVFYTPVDGTRGTGFFSMVADQSTHSPEWVAKRNAEFGIDRQVP